PPAPELTYPADNETIRRTTFGYTWQPVEGASKYHIQVSRYADFRLPYVPGFDLFVDDASHRHPFRGRYSPGVDYYWRVRARSAEALGYVAMEHPEVASPKLLADLHVGLSFDEPEVREKLAKALAAIAIGNPDRLSHHVSNLADHLDDENDLVRYHLCTALAVVGCVSPSTLTDASTALTERSADENPYVRGRAAEALGLLAETGSPGIAAFADALPEPNGMEPFEADRVRFARDALAGESSAEATVGSVEAIRETTADVEESVDAPERTHTCPHCGLSQQEAGPPTCPRCGVPR
ncbi:MAG: HEAT repeat domain-containing protein, partial [Halolamina sp.]